MTKKVTQLEPGIVRCERCQKTYLTAAPPERCHCICDRTDRPTAAKKEPTPCIGACPGTELVAINKSLGYDACSFCLGTAAKMDDNGPGWCADHREELKAEINRNFELIACGIAKKIDALDKPLTEEQRELVRQGKLKELTLDQKIESRGKLATMAAKAAMMTKGAIHAAGNWFSGDFVPDKSDPIGSLLDEAIRRARTKAI